MTIRAGEGRYDASMGLCADYTHHIDKTRTSKYNGHYVAWMSPPYAEALLATGKDIKLAAQILERICDFQETDPGLPSYGNYFGVAEWGEVGDANAVAFLTTALGYIWLEHGDRLPKKTRDKLYKSLDLAAVGLVRRQADVFYTNIYLLCITGKIFLGRILDRPDLLDLAETEFNCYLDRLTRENNSEYNSPTYSAVQIECLLLVRDYAVNTKMKKRAEAALEYLLTLYALHYHMPSHVHSGTLSRAYREGLLSHVDGTDFMAYALFGHPLRDTLDEKTEGRNRSFAGIHWTRSDYLPPQHLQELFQDKPFPVRIDEQNVSYWGRDNEPRVIERASDQNTLYSLATQYGVWTSYGHFLPFHITFAANTKRRSFFIQNEPETALIDSWFRQTEDTAAGAFFWKFHGYPELAFWKKQPPFISHQIAHLGTMDDIDQLLFNGRKWNRKSKPRPGTTLTVVRPEIEVRFRFLEMPEGVRAPEMEIVEELGDYAIHLVYAEAETADKFHSQSPCVCPLVVEIRPGGPEREWKEKKIRTSRKGDFWRIRIGDLETVVPLSLEARDQLAEASNPPLDGNLVESTHFTIDTAGLQKRFQLK